MSRRQLNPISQPLFGEIDVPGDKSISHRAVILGSLAKGETKVTHFLTSDDCLHTINAFRALGVCIEKNGSTLYIRSNGHFSLTEPKAPLYFGNSGTTARLMLGVLAGIPLFTTIYGDPFLTERPMDRVVHPLRQMGATIDGRLDGNYLPIMIRGKQLDGMTYTLPVKSAQVKSALLLAGLFAQGETTVVEQAMTRNHTENMLKAFGAHIDMTGDQITVSHTEQLTATNVHVPGDISSAAFFLAGAAIVPGSQLTLKSTGLNETRTGIIDVLQQMGADLHIHREQQVSGERFGNITINYKQLYGITIEGDIIPRLIDEIPIIALLATQAKGTTIIKNAEELRVKETDRISAVVNILSKLGADIEETPDGMIIKGPTPLYGNNVSAYHDHRMAMMIAIASLIAQGTVILDDDSSIDVSYPQFFEHLHQVSQ